MVTVVIVIGGIVAIHASLQFNLNNFVDEIFPGTLLLYNSTVNEVVENAVETLVYVCKRLDQKQMLSVLSVLKQTLLSLQKIADASSIPGFACSKVSLLEFPFILGYLFQITMHHLFTNYFEKFFREKYF